MQIPEEIQKECKKRFKDMVFFMFNQRLQKFVCKVRNPAAKELTYDLFIVEDSARNFRPVTMEDVHRAENAKIFNSEEENRRAKEVLSQGAKEKRAILEKQNAPKLKKKEVLGKLANSLVKSPQLAKAFEKDAKKKFSVSGSKKGKKTVLKASRRK